MSTFWGKAQLSEKEWKNEPLRHQGHEEKPRKADVKKKRQDKTPHPYPSPITWERGENIRMLSIGGDHQEPICPLRQIFNSKTPT